MTDLVKILGLPADVEEAGVAVRAIDPDPEAPRYLSIKCTDGSW